ncbi:MAG TPA: methyltransferase domain-containing protein, partial [Vicinamibacterales bacterium]|nr:methyltransferase domain-containing protein [Vicinamibacterales bacterium]
MTRNDMLRAGRLVLVLVAAAVAAATAQERSAHEARREQWQRVGDILETMGVRPGSMVADIGAGDGFFTTRLATAVGPSGRVYAVDISDQALARLRRRLADDGAENVIVIKGAPDDPRLPNGTLDAALIVNAYHEMDEHQAMLAALRRALKPDGRLVIVEPISERRRGASRAEQVRSHEIAPEHVVAEARSAGFRIVSLQDPFAERDNDVEWLIVLQTGPAPGNTAPPSNVETPMSSPCSRELDDPVL